MMDQVVGRTVMGKLRFGSALKFGNNALRQDLPQFHAPLIEWIDVPQSGLGEDVMLIQRHQLTEHFRCEPVGEQDIRRAIALKDPVWHKPFRSTLSLDLVARLAK